MWRLGDPWLLALLILPLIVLGWSPRRGGAAFGGFLLASRLRPSRGPLLWRVLMASGLALLVGALARPQFGTTIIERTQEGRDLLLVIDLSGSMRIDDLADKDGGRIDRLSAVMTAAKEFIAGRPDDRIGLVFFAARALTSCPPTYDHQTALDFLTRTEEQQRALWAREREGLLGGSTNLGLGLGTALKVMRDPAAKGRAAILITDGVDSRGEPGWVDPLQAGRHAASIGVRVHGIGVGNPNGTRTARDIFGRVQLVPIQGELLPDLGRLRSITSLAGGEAFSANDAAGLKEVFTKIDALEPTPRTTNERDDVSDRFHLLLWLGLGLIALALTLEPRLRGRA